MPKWTGTSEPISIISALKRQDCNSLAQETLEKVYRYVLPIMRKRKYRVNKLVEFLPKNPNLLGLNVNHGQSISLRLRYHHNPKSFLPFESVLGTMLHELCHNTFGPHNADFFKLLDELTSEMEDLIARGYRGDPFLGTGRKLADTPQSYFTNNNRTNKPYEGRRRGLGKGRKLGGLGARPTPANRSSIRNLALEAAERRRQADNSCKTANKVEELESDERGEVIDLTSDAESENEDALHTIKKTKSAKRDTNEKDTKPRNHSELKKSESSDIIYILD